VEHLTGTRTDKDPAMAASITSRTTTGTVRTRVLALAATVAATGAVWLVAHATGVDFRLQDGGGAVVIGLGITAGFTLFFSLLGWGALALLERFSRRASVIWTRLAVSVLVLSFVPIFLETATAGTKASLFLIHLAVGVVLISRLRAGRRG
jgi:hypothetical protein